MRCTTCAALQRTCDVAGDVLHGDLLVQGEPVALGLRSGAVHQDAAVCGEPREGQADVLIHRQDLAHCGHVLQLGRELALHACACALAQCLLCSSIDSKCALRRLHMLVAPACIDA